MSFLTTPHRRFAFRRVVSIALLLLAMLTGCTGDKKPAPVDSPSVAAPFEVHLLVVDDPDMAAAISQLRGDWQARTGATLSISELKADELAASASLPAGTDAVIFPSAQLGLLAERALIAPLPADLRGNRELAWSDTFELLQVAECAWGKVSYAIPFGSPVLTCYYRADLFERFHKRPPATWAEYHDLAAFFNRRENLGDAAPGADHPWCGAIEPLAPGWAGRVLLARAAAYTKNRDHFSDLFQIDTMEPLIGGPPLVRALEEMVADAKLGPPNVRLDLSGVRREMLAGHAALALTVPGHAGRGESKSEQPVTGVAFAELPGSPKVYDVASQQWNQRSSGDNPRVTLLGFSGRLGAVAEESQRADNAWQLLAWLSGQEWGSRISSASPATTLYRRSQLRAPLPWLDPLTDAEAAAQYAHGVQDALSRPAWLFMPRFAGYERYLTALDTAVTSALTGEKSPADALAAAAATWRTITTELGLDAQRAAYRKSVGLDD